MRALLQTYFNYNVWAQDKFFDALDTMTPEEFLRDMGDGTGSVRDKLAHIYGAESVWFERIQGVPSPPFPDAAMFPDSSTLMTKWKDLRRRMSAWFDTITEDNLKQNLSYKNLAGKDFTSPLWQVLTHLTNHGTYHRGQAASLIRRIKGKPPVTDLIAYYREQEI